MRTRQGWPVYPLAGMATVLLAAAALQHAASAERPVHRRGVAAVPIRRHVAAASHGVSLRAGGIRTVADSKRRAAASSAEQGVPAMLPGGVVTVDAYEEGDDTPTHRKGTGVLASRLGHVFTPLFVVADADVVIVNFGGDKHSPARVIARDTHSQLAILRVLSPPETLACPTLCTGSGEQANTNVVMYSPDGSRCQRLPGTVLGMREKAGPLTDVLEVSLHGNPGEMGGVVLTAGGDVVGIAMATLNPEASVGGAHVLVLPASQIRQAMDRILKGTPGSDTQKERPVSVA